MRLFYTTRKRFLFSLKWKCLLFTLRIVRSVELGLFHDHFMVVIWKIQITYIYKYKTYTRSTYRIIAIRIANLRTVEPIVFCKLLIL